MGKYLQNFDEVHYQIYLVQLYVYKTNKCIPSKDYYY